MDYAEAMKESIRKGLRPAYDMSDSQSVQEFMQFIDLALETVFIGAIHAVGNGKIGKENKTDLELHRKITVWGHNAWNDIAKMVDDMNIPCKMASGDTTTLTLEPNGFILYIIRFDEDLRAPFIHALEDIIKDDLDKITKASEEAHPVEEDPILEHISDNAEAMKEFFEVFSDLGVFTKSRVYETEEDYRKHDKLIALYRKIMNP